MASNTKMPESQQLPHNYVPKTEWEITEYYKSNVRLLHFLLQNFKSADDYEDLLQEASIGFFKAVRSYKPEKNTKLSTHIVNCALNELRMYFRRNNAACRSAILVSLDPGSEPDESDTSSLLNRDWSEGDVIRQSAISVEEAVERSSTFKKALKVVNTRLPEIQRVAIYGLMTDTPQSITAKILGVSQGSVSKALKQGICEVRRILIEQGDIDPDDA